MAHVPRRAPATRANDESNHNEIPASKTVYVVDHDPVPRTAIKSLIINHVGVSVATFDSAEEFLAHCSRDMRGCIVTDLFLGGMNGLDFQSRLTARGIPLPFVFVSGRANVDVTVRAMRNGAVTVLEKPWNDDELADVVCEALRLEADWSQQHKRRHAAQTRLAGLTSQERSVLDLIVAGKSNKQISYAMDVSLRTIERRRQSIFRKTNTTNAVELAELVRWSRTDMDDLGDLGEGHGIAEMSNL